MNKERKKEKKTNHVSCICNRNLLKNIIKKKKKQKKLKDNHT